MLKAKRLKSMFVLYSACAVMATGFTSQAASEQSEVTTITETKGENTNTHTAVQAVSYTHLDVYKRQALNIISELNITGGCNVQYALLSLIHI